MFMLGALMTSGSLPVGTVVSPSAAGVVLGVALLLVVLILVAMGDRTDKHPGVRGRAV